MDLKGKIVNFLGDSITEGAGVEDLANCRYDNRLKQLLGLKAVYNYGIGGTRFAHQSSPSENPRYDLCFCGRAYNLNPNADLIVVYGGVNDCLHGDAPIGEWGDSTPSTFYGAADWLMRFLTDTYPQAKIVFLTPARYYMADNDNYMLSSPREVKRADARPVRFYGEVIMKTAEKYSIPVLDMYEAVPLDVADEATREKYTADGLHFNDAGHAVLAEVIGDFLLSL